MDAVQSWYEDAFKACGYAFSGTQQSGQDGVQLSQGITETKQDGRNQLEIDLSFASATDGGTLILYVAVAITPPQYPVPGSILRVPGKPIELSITRYAGMNPGPIRPLRTVDVRDAATAASLADEINHLLKPLGPTISCPLDDGSHDTLLFRDTDGSTHPVYVGLRGCQMVLAPPAPPGHLGDDLHLLPRIDALLQGPGSRSLPYPYDARSLRAVKARRLGASPGRFLSTGQNGSHLLYLSRGNLFTEPAAGGSRRLLASGIADASFDVDDLSVLARPLSSRDLTHLLLINATTGKPRPFQLPADTALVGRTAGAGPPGLADALACDPQYVWFATRRRIAGIDPEHSVHDRFQSARFLPAPERGQLTAISCSGADIATYQPGKGLVIRNVGFVEGRVGPVLRRVSVPGVTFLSWAPDDEHLAYRTDGTLFVLDVQTGRIRQLMRVGRDVIHGAAWDPWSHVMALSVTSPGEPVSRSRVALADIAGQVTGRLRLPFTGASRLDWSTWTGQTIGVTRVTAHGTQACAISLPPLPPDPGQELLGSPLARVLGPAAAGLVQ
jgi:hypothetical protein